MGKRNKREKRERGGGKLGHKGAAEEHKLPAALLSIAFPAVAAGSVG